MTITAEVTKTPPFGCARCSIRWGGYITAHCGGCHHTFTSVRSFDMHRRGSRCNDPAGFGLVLNSRGYWAQAGTKPMLGTGFEGLQGPSEGASTGEAAA